MTAQVPDGLEYGGTAYALVAVLGGPLFDPAAHGIEPRMMHTGCWRGYVVTYGVVDERLVVRRVELGMGSTIDGAEITPTTALLGRTPSSLPERGSITFDLDAPLPFTGGLVGGDGFVHELYVHMGFQQAWKYERVVELMVVDGAIVETVDRSEEMADVRRRVRSGEVANPDDPGADVHAWVVRTFSLDHRRSLGR